MRVIVVNCSRWTEFPRLVRQEALDLYAEESGVEFWDLATSAADDAAMVWGQWPKAFAGRSRRFQDEIIDRTSEVPPGGLTVIMMFGRPDHLPQPPGSASTVRGISEAEKEAANAIAGIASLMRTSVAAPRHERVLWIAAFRQLDDKKVDSIFQAVRPAWDGAPVFETAVLLGRRVGERDNAVFAALRVLVDIARDEAAEVRLLRAAPNSLQGRVFSIGVGVVARNPGHTIRYLLSDQIRQATEAESSITQSKDADQIEPLVQDLLRSVKEQDSRQAVDFAQEMARETTDLFAEGPGRLRALEAWHTVRRVARESRQYTFQILSPAGWLRGPAGLPGAGAGTGDSAEELLAKERVRLDAFRKFVDRRLAEERAAMDGLVRNRDREKLLTLHRKFADRSFGVSGQVGRFLDAHSKTLQGNYREFMNAAHALRQDYTIERGKFSTFGVDSRDTPIDKAYEKLVVALDKWLPLRAVLTACGVTLLVVFAFFYFPLPIFDDRSDLLQWFPSLGILLALGAGSGVIFLMLRKIEKDRSEAAAKLMKALADEIALINKAGQLGLQHIAAAMKAGRCLPFVELIGDRRDKLRDVRLAMTKVRGSLDEVRRPAGDKDDVDPKLVNLAETILGEKPVEDALKEILWRWPSAPAKEAEIVFEGGEGRSAMGFKSSLDFSSAVNIQTTTPPEAI